MNTPRASNNQEVFQYKVIVMGEQGVGKSSIIRNLLTGELDSSKTITHGEKNE